MGNNPVRNMPENPQDEIFQVKIFNAGNTCYLDSVLFAMFAVPSPAFEQLLTKR
ncbi:hypothetical protein GUITHDRAFT_150521 [Guillardia theta CCMP2712]|uniref:USP domain-containing protein n=1 Tax=Guillardia theta (strain CCMP2712) TaxID=905079 RepID=L1JWY5_GUITC|nr:hypothetical protein GUITHDRAFT_150521 [Guillardia theta CCMP2712]EKX53096.1 hypothetical protein GUITHDRAFT_150521 [Guillardia theta CCMP2712]|eukprot:XP_005840076.1 hypothetical protein GUITHDRAFT_150521 [Guillardia theta CCMP2712]